MAESPVLVAILLAFGVPASAATPADQEAIRRVCARFADALSEGKIGEARKCFAVQNSARAPNYICSPSEFLNAVLELETGVLQLDTVVSRKWGKSINDIEPLASSLSHDRLKSWRYGIDRAHFWRVGPYVMAVAGRDSKLEHPVLFRNVQGQWQLAAPPFTNPDDYSDTFQSWAFANVSYALVRATKANLNAIQRRVELGEIGDYHAFTRELRRSIGADRPSGLTLPGPEYLDKRR